MDGSIFQPIFSSMPKNILISVVVMLFIFDNLQCRPNIFRMNRRKYLLVSVTESCITSFKISNWKNWTGVRDCIVSIISMFSGLYGYVWKINSTGYHLELSSCGGTVELLNHFLLSLYLSWCVKFRTAVHLYRFFLSF